MNKGIGGNFLSSVRAFVHTLQLPLSNPGSPIGNPAPRQNSLNDDVCVSSVDTVRLNITEPEYYRGKKLPRKRITNQLCWFWHPIVGRVAHVPYPSGVEKGTGRGVHGRKGSAVWVEYPGSTTLYEVARHLLFPTPEEAERHRQNAQGGKRNPKTNPSPPPQTNRLTPRLPPDKDPNPAHKPH